MTKKLFMIVRHSSNVWPDASGLLGIHNVDENLLIAKDDVRDQRICFFNGWIIETKLGNVSFLQFCFIDLIPIQ